MRDSQRDSSDNTEEKKGRFASVKRKLNFDEDVIGLQAYDNGLARYGGRDSNPFLKLLDSSDSVPKFEHNNGNNNQCNNDQGNCNKHGMTTDVGQFQASSGDV